MKTNQVMNATPISKTEALSQARHIIGTASHAISINGDAVDTNIKQMHEQKVASAAVTLLRKSEMKVVTQSMPATVSKTFSNGRSSSDPLDTLSRVESENNSTEKNEAEDPLAAESRASQKVSSFYILTSSFKSMASKYVNMFRGETKKAYQKTAIYLFEKATSETSMTKAS